MERDRVGMLSALVEYRDYRQLWISTVLTQIGQWMLQITLGWLMLVLTDSAAYVGLVGFAAGIPFLVVSIPAGVLMDRLDRRRLMLVCQFAALLTSLALAILVSAGLAEPWHLLLAAFLNGAALTITSGVRQTLVPTFVRREHLQNGVALMSAGMSVTRILGPALGGPLIAWAGGDGALYMQTLFLATALVNTWLLPSVPPRTGTLLTIRRTLVDGLSYIRQSRALGGLILISAVPTLLIFPYVQFLPVYARDILDIGANGLGVLLVGGGLGSLLGSLAIAGVRDNQYSGVIMVAALLLYGTLMVVFAFSTWVPLSVAILFLTGIFGSASLAINNTLVHMIVSDEMRGRVMGVYLLTFGLMPLGTLPIGIFGDRYGVEWAVGIAAALATVAMATVVFRFRTILQF